MLNSQQILQMLNEMQSIVPNERRVLWEAIVSSMGGGGGGNVDISGKLDTVVYLVDKTASDALIAGKIDAASVAATYATLAGLAAKADSATVNAALGLKLDASTALSTYATQAAMATALALKADITAVNVLIAATAPLVHSHVVSDVTGLQAALDAKADTITLTTGLATKANASHNHVIADVVGLQASLDSKASAAALTTLAGDVSANLAAQNNGFAQRPVAVAPAHIAQALLPNPANIQAYVTATPAFAGKRIFYTGTNTPTDVITWLWDVDINGVVYELQSPSASAPFPTSFSINISNQPVKRIVQTINAAGMTAANAVIVSMGAYLPTDDNDAEWLNIESILAIAGINNFTITINFLYPTMGNIKLNWRKI